MLAQYRSGRQAEALETYRLMRERLADELGVDPSPTLRDVYQRILQGDQEAPRPLGNPAGSRSLTVITLPRRATRFVGRAQELSRLADALRKGPLLTLTGVGGVGKTRSRSRWRAAKGAIPRRRMACEGLRRSTMLRRWVMRSQPPCVCNSGKGSTSSRL